MYWSNRVVRVVKQTGGNIRPEEVDGLVHTNIHRTRSFSKITFLSNYGDLKICYRY